jgi:hypothetical protein
MADILDQAGYSDIKILDAIKYPKLKSVKLALIAAGNTPDSDSIIIFSEIGEIESNDVDLYDTVILKTPVYPTLSYCTFSPRNMFEFSFGTKVNEQLIGYDRLTIPVPSDWPTPVILLAKEDLS